MHRWPRRHGSPAAQGEAIAASLATGGTGCRCLWQGSGRAHARVGGAVLTWHVSVCRGPGTAAALPAAARRMAAWSLPAFAVRRAAALPAGRAAAGPERRGRAGAVGAAAGRAGAGAAAGLCAAARRPASAAAAGARGGVAGCGGAEKGGPAPACGRGGGGPQAARGSSLDCVQVGRRTGALRGGGRQSLPACTHVPGASSLVGRALFSDDAALHASGSASGQRLRSPHCCGAGPFGGSLQVVVRPGQPAATTVIESVDR
jgi:hypothetical protein